MITHNVIQGSPEWHALRAEHFNASEAPAVMGESKYMSRAQLIRQKATGVVPEVDAATQRRFDAGHETEAKARAILEQRMGEELYPVVATRDKLLASVDGIDMLDSTLFEHKLLNQDVVAMIEAGELTGQYYWQLEQQLYVTGAERVLFVCSDGTEDNFHMLEYRAVPGRIEQLIAGWEQFAQDVAAYQPEESAPEAVGKAPESLPALRIELTGMVTASNLDEFKATALAVIGNVNDQLETDQDFADAEQAVKWCSDVEGRLKAAKDHALSQTSTIDELFRALDEISETARQKRLALDKLVKARKTQIREDIVMTAAKALTGHIAALNEGLGPRIRLPDYRADFNGAIKGKKTIASLRDAADTELAEPRLRSARSPSSTGATLSYCAPRPKGLNAFSPTLNSWSPRPRMIWKRSSLPALPSTSKQSRRSWTPSANASSVKRRKQPKRRRLPSLRQKPSASRKRRYPGRCRQRPRRLSPRLRLAARLAASSSWATSMPALARSASALMASPSSESSQSAKSVPPCCTPSRTGHAFLVC
ncbi:YqaJ viral recombinase family protein [Halopseudomonas pachastrellae]|nr:YqaJ viral recombinase family protein [Halopseudomonas pachastrellae]